MALSLYDLCVPTFRQSIGAVSGFLDKATRHCAATGTDPDELVDQNLFFDMAPLHFQIEALTHHATCAVDAVITGVFASPPLVGSMPFADLQAMVVAADDKLLGFEREEVDACAGRALDLQIGPRRLQFTAETYILSFALPNFHFHAATAYNILRTNGVPISKADYEGVLRVAIS